MSDTPSILFTRLQNIGDVLNAIPALRALRQAMPRARIIFLGKHVGGLEIMRNCPYVDEMIVVKGRGLMEKLRLIRAFRRLGLDYFIISPQDLGRVPWAWLGGARKIVGYPRMVNYGRTVREKLPFLLDIAPKYDPTRTEVDNCLTLVEDVLDDAGIEEGGAVNRDLEYSWYTPDDEATAARALDIAGVQPGETMVASAPFSKRPAKNWPMERYVSVFSRMISEWKARVVLLGGVDERGRTEELARTLGSQCVSLAGVTPLPSSAVVIKKARLFVGPDSGPAFLATAVGTPAVVLYGPADYYRWRVAHHAVPRIELVHPVPCSPCGHQECPKQPGCMEQLSIEDVGNACSTLYG